MTVSGGYAYGQWAKALTTAGAHGDEATRTRAVKRLRKWTAVLAGLADGTLTIGSRTPTAGLPAWVTPDVVRGGFATGPALAGGPLTADEIAVAERVGIPATRIALFAYFLSEPGLAELQALLDNGAYRVDVPEAAALLAVAWLARNIADGQDGQDSHDGHDDNGDNGDLQELLATLAPFADRLRFTPERTAASDETTDADHGPEVVQRETVGEVRATLARRPANPRIAAMNEALSVWNPFSDEVLALWLRTDVGGRVGASFTPEWRDQATELLARYRILAAEHTWCTKHRKPKENLAILLAALTEALTDRELSARQRGLLQHAVDSMVRRRGMPGGAEHSALRAAQAGVAARPTHARLAQMVDARLAPLPQGAGLRDVSAALAPITVEDGRTFVVPNAVARLVRQATAGTVAELIDAGVVGSLEVVAELLPEIVGSHSADAYRDPSLRTLMSRHYSAFRNRRSLLLLDYQHQVRIGELPWMVALQGLRETGDAYRADMVSTLRRVASQALAGFPATLLPNPLVREFAALSGEADARLPWVEELAADIFMGDFTVKYLQAAQSAGRLLANTLYEDYYGIDYDVLLAMSVPRQPDGGAPIANAFGALCRDRAHLPPSHRSLVARNGMVIEQAQILTTHNLATLAGAVGVVPDGGWATAARRAFEHVCLLAERLERVPRVLPVIKDMAYAWRHMVFYASLLDEAELTALHAGLRDTATRAGRSVSRTLKPVIAGLEDVLAGEDFAEDGGSTHGRRLLGWSATGHWLMGMFGDERRVAYKS
ncbi:hypothetical protein KGQ19_44265 [Catenulispora sp. NL8]|uniref:Uncharacterized protein n=1 Tax=Catenulispora pinistramenti TaxID=2705254 RepID=A0ABS5L6C5_9ACTN|nr:hypothetical protein [Catenulispora pinistramenti]MBS2553891.1 hypothetical protein [Catenulispora pinistramenti]